MCLYLQIRKTQKTYQYIYNTLWFAAEINTSGRKTATLLFFSHNLELIMENVYILKFVLHNQPHMNVVSGVVNLLSSTPGTALHMQGDVLMSPMKHTWR